MFAALFAALFRDPLLLVVNAGRFSNKAQTTGFVCKDLSKDCPQWKKNMGGNCQGSDYLYMLKHCPRTCGMCGDAQKKWESQEAERKANPTYEPRDSKVIVLDAESIHDYLEQESEESLILLELYAPWCGHCQHVAPEFREAAKQLHNLNLAGSLPVPVKLAKFDDSAQKNREYRASDAHKWNISSYPSMFLVGGPEEYPYEDGEKKELYRGQKASAEAIVFYMAALAHGQTQEEAWHGYLDVEKGKKPGMYKKGGKHETTELVELDLDNFVEEVLHSDAVWVVEYYSDKCPICNSMAPSFIEGAQKAQAEFPDHRLRYGAVNSRIFGEELATPYGVTSYPWITSFYLGENTGHMAGAGGWESFYNWGKKKVDENWEEGRTANLDAAIPEVEEDEGGEEGA